MSKRKIDKISLDLLLEYAATLPTSPRIFARLSQLIQKEDTALDYISSLVKMDPGLAAQILRVTNSAYYGGSLKVTDLETAISRIGFLEVQKILSMVVAHDCFYQAVPAYGISATEFADTCVETAVTSEVLAKRFGFDPNAPYIAGLLHGIGKLAIDLYLNKVGQTQDITALAGERSLEDTERDILGLTSWRAGSELLSHWQFESNVWYPIKNQHAPASAPAYEKQTAILTLALWIARQLQGGYDSEAGLPDTTTWALKTLSIDALDIAMLIDEARFEIIDRKNMLSMLL